MNFKELHAYYTTSTIVMQPIFTPGKNCRIGKIRQSAPACSPPHRKCVLVIPGFIREVDAARVPIVHTVQLRTGFSCVCWFFMAFRLVNAENPSPHRSATTGIRSGRTFTLGFLSGLYGGSSGSSNGSDSGFGFPGRVI